MGKRTGKVARERDSQYRPAWPGSFHAPCLSGFREPCRAVAMITLSDGALVFAR